MRMAEPEKKSSSPFNSKEKNSDLDLDIGKDFLTSWKSTSVTANGLMDFEIGSAANGKNNIFKFDKSDMDFNLGGDFDKISSFKIDMSDLDISAPAKRTKEKSTEPSGVKKHQSKADSFNFAFEFNDLDRFSFDSGFSKGKTKSKKNDVQEVSSGNSGSQGSEVQKKDADDKTLALPEADVVTSKFDAQIGDARDIDLKHESSSAKSISNNIHYSSDFSDGKHVPLLETITSSKKTNSTSSGTNQETQQSERTASSRQYTPKSLRTLSVQSISQHLGHDEACEVQDEVTSQPKSVGTISGGEQNVNPRPFSRSTSNCEPPPLQSSYLLQEEISQNKEGSAKSDQVALLNEHVSTTQRSRESVQAMKASGDNECSTPKLHVAALCRKETKCHSTQTGTKTNGGASILDHGITLGGSTLSRNGKNIEDLPNSGVQNPKEVTRVGSIRTSLQLQSRKSNKIEPLPVGSIGSDLEPNSNRVELIANGAQTGSKFDANSKSPDHDLMRSPILRGIQTNSQVHSTLRRIGASQDLPISTFQSYKVKSFKNMKQNLETQRLSGVMMAPVDTEKRTPPTPSLKRKTFEGVNVEMPNLNPLKRLSELPVESSNFATCGVLGRREIKMAETDASLEEESNNNVEKAGTFAKDLDDICNMLKKKHEEAKEILVRAIVNNNYFLMLNHPANEAKIRAVQKFAAQLMSEDLNS